MNRQGYYARSERAIPQAPRSANGRLVDPDENDGGRRAHQSASDRERTREGRYLNGKDDDLEEDEDED